MLCTAAFYFVCFPWQIIFPVNFLQTAYWQKTVPHIGNLKLQLAQPGSEIKNKWNKKNNKEK